jgi:PAS domain S-box-containing protein
MRKTGEKKGLKYPYHYILDTVPIPIFEVDRNLIITLANRSAHKRWPSIVEGKTLSYEVLFSVGKKPEHCIVEETFKLKKPQSAEIETERGEIFDVKTNYIREKGSKKVVVHVFDITKRINAEETLRESEERYRTLQSNIPVGVFRSTPGGKILSANPAMVKMFGYDSEEELVAVPAVDCYLFPEQRETLLKGLRDKGSVTDFEVQLKRKDGSSFWCSINLKGVFNQQGSIIHQDGIMEDITERKRAEEALQKAHDKLEMRVEERTKELAQSNKELQKEIAQRKRVEEQIKEALKEKEALLKEIHHRVKNNLQVISSLLNLQSRYIKDEQALEVLKNSQERVRTMALIHEKLYRSRGLSRIDFREYIQSLITYLFDSYSLQQEQVQLKMQIENVVLDIETAIPLGLIINELISNAFKHAFPGNRKGELLVNLEKSEDEEHDHDCYTLIVGDNGIGFPDGLDFRNSNSLGLELVFILVKQLRGVIDLEKENGTKFTINFKTLK